MRMQEENAGLACRRQGLTAAGEDHEQTLQVGKAEERRDRLS
jgi:hypothetical protein